jgi:hypothetical protein
MAPRVDFRRRQATKFAGNNSTFPQLWILLVIQRISGTGR